MAEPLLLIDGLWKRLCRRHDRAVPHTLADISRQILGRPPRLELRAGEFWALQDINLAIAPGQVVGVIGHNGAGKSTLINLVTGVILPTAGSIHIKTPRIAMIDANGGLNPLETGRENAATLLALYGLPTAGIPREIEAVEEFAGIDEFIDAPVSTYSLGMRLRLAFSIYTRLAPELFVIDEALGGGDQRFRNRFRRFLRDYVDAGGAILLCSHEMTLIQAFCHHCILLDQGRMIAAGEPTDVITTYQERIEEDEALKKEEKEEPSETQYDDICRINSVKLKTENNLPVSSGGSLMIELEISVSQNVNGLACSIDISNAERISIATLIYGHPDGNITLQSPMTTVRCYIDKLPLAPGNFEVRFSLFTPTAGTTLASLGWDGVAIPMKVTAKDTNPAIVMRQMRNLINIPASWELTTNHSELD
jgi:lipopolysaccharide transport system ATP-binding protein